MKHRHAIPNKTPGITWQQPEAETIKDPKRDDRGHSAAIDGRRIGFVKSCWSNESSNRFHNHARTHARKQGLKFVSASSYDFHGLCKIMQNCIYMRDS